MIGRNLRKIINTDLSFTIWMLLANTREAIYKARSRELRIKNIAPRQATVLHSIKYLGRNASPTEISKVLFRERNSISAILVRMEKKGLIKRSSHSKIKNSYIFSLTPSGKKAYIQSVKRTSVLEIISTLSMAEQKRLISLLTKLNHAAQNYLLIKKMSISIESLSNLSAKDINML